MDPKELAKQFLAKDPDVIKRAEARWDAVRPKTKAERKEHYNARVAEKAARREMQTKYWQDGLAKGMTSEEINLGWQDVLITLRTKKE